MKVVIDTNVVISAALKDRDPEAVLCLSNRTPFYPGGVERYES
jgi:predicted nucleic acid-binding protein